MSLLQIVQYPDPLLKKKSAPVPQITRETSQLIDNMFETMYAAPGIGLAAPQVGILQRILVIDIEDRLKDDAAKPRPIALVNPVITNREGEVVWQEGCLSLPHLIVPVKRSAKVLVEGLSREGKGLKIEAEGLLAVAFQHEIDHLDGILLVDRLSRLKRDLYLQKLKKGETFDEESTPKGEGRAYIG